MTREDFVRKYANVYEHSPWVAEAAFDACADIQTAMKAAVDTASREAKLTLMRNHPDLACAPVTKLTQSSTSEQVGAGLRECSPEEFSEFTRLNADYKKKFGFPFIIAVKGLTRGDILHAFRTRINNDTVAEFDTAIEQIHKIASFRLQALN